MPHPRKHLKLTGDTHPPEVEDDLGPDEEVRAAPAAAEPAGAAAVRTPVARPAAVRSIVVSMPARQYVDAAREQVRARPLATAAVAFFAGFAVAVLTRSR
jgi:hypothetical protein